jgi:hypothetical protein
MKLTVDIKYKSNSQQGGLKGTLHHALIRDILSKLRSLAKRRNKWICALKTTLAELKIFGPKGDPDAPLPTKRYAKVPWNAADHGPSRDHLMQAEPRSPIGGWKLTGKNAVIRKIFLICQTQSQN